MLKLAYLSLTIVVTAFSNFSNADTDLMDALPNNTRIRIVSDIVFEANSNEYTVVSTWNPLRWHGTPKFGESYCSLMASYSPKARTIKAGDIYIVKDARAATGMPISIFELELESGNKGDLVSFACVHQRVLSYRGDGPDIFNEYSQEFPETMSLKEFRDLMKRDLQILDK